MPWWFDIAKDVRHAVRSVLRSPGFSSAIIATLALGIGANSATFAIINAVLFRPLPFPESERVVSVSRTENGVDRGYLDDATYRALAAGAVPGLDAVSALRTAQMVLTLPEERSPVSVHTVSARYFTVFRMRPLLGRVFSAEEDMPGAPDVVVLTEALWRSAFGADSAIIGRSVVLDGRRHTVLGVVPEIPISVLGAQLWAPLRLPAPHSALTLYLEVSARLRPGATIEGVQAEIRTLALQLRQESATQGMPRRLGWAVMTVHERRYGETRTPLLLLWSAVGILLLIACANIAQLTLARAARREREIALRLALGASRFRTVRLLLCESLALSLAGAVLGLLIAWPTVSYLVRSSPGVLSTARGVGVDGTAFLYTFALATGAAVACGLFPALRVTRGSASLALMTGSPRATGNRGEILLRRVLIVGQLATALVLLTGAAIVTKTLVRVATIDLGFRASDLYSLRPILSESHTAATTAAFYDELAGRLRGEPGVVSVALADAAPMSSVRVSRTLSNADGSRTPADRIVVDSDYFTTIGARIVDGRAFTTEDREGAAGGVVINVALARELFGDRSAVGQLLHPDDPRLVIGVVQNIRQRGLEAPVNGIIYSPVTQTDRPGFAFLLVRTSPTISDFSERARRIVRAMDPDLRPPSVTSLAGRRDQALAPRRFVAVLAMAFAAIATLLATIGLYGALSFLITERTREIGIRVALGANPARVLRSIMGDGLLLTGVGVLIGAIGAGLTVRALEGLVYGMSVYDPWMFSSAAVLLTLVGLIATWAPARHAAAIDPVKAIRAD